MKEVTYGEIIRIFKDAYPNLIVTDYRPFYETPCSIIVWVKQKDAPFGVDNSVRPIIFQTNDEGIPVNVYEYGS